MSQPIWKFKRVLGDIGVPEYDGAIHLVDENGVYPRRTRGVSGG